MLQGNAVHQYDDGRIMTIATKTSTLSMVNGGEFQQYIPRCAAIECLGKIALLPDHCFSPHVSWLSHLFLASHDHFALVNRKTFTTLRVKRMKKSVIYEPQQKKLCSAFESSCKSKYQEVSRHTRCQSS